MVLCAIQVYKIAMKTCEHYIHCSTCVTSRDPNGCGWCGGVCTTREECEDAEGPSSELPKTEVDSEDGPEWVTDACSPAIYQVDDANILQNLFCKKHRVILLQWCRTEMAVQL